MAKEPLQVKDIAAKLGIHEVTLTRLRRGHRLPSIPLMQKIEDELGWKVAKQMAVHDQQDRQKYANALRAFMEKEYGIPADPAATTESE